jgi:hypothetical protein
MVAIWNYRSAHLVKDNPMIFPAKFWLNCFINSVSINVCIVLKILFNGGGHLRIILFNSGGHLRIILFNGGVHLRIRAATTTLSY